MLETPRQYSLVTVVDNTTGESMSGHILEYTKERIVIRNQHDFKGGSKLSETKITTFDATKVHFA